MAQIDLGWLGGGSTMVLVDWLNEWMPAYLCYYMLYLWLGVCAYVCDVGLVFGSPKCIPIISEYIYKLFAQ